MTLSKIWEEQMVARNCTDQISETCTPVKSVFMCVGLEKTGCIVKKGDNILNHSAHQTNSSLGFIYYNNIFYVCSEPKYLSALSGSPDQEVNLIHCNTIFIIKLQ